MNAPSETRLTGSGRFTGRVMKDRFGCRRELLWRIDLQVDAPSGGQISMVDIRLPVRTWQDLPGTHVADVPRTRRPADGEFLSTTGAGPVRIGTENWTGLVDRLTFGKKIVDNWLLDAEIALRELNGARNAVIDAWVTIIGIHLDEDPQALQAAAEMLDIHDFDITRNEEGVLLRPNCTEGT